MPIEPTGSPFTFAGQGLFLDAAEMRRDQEDFIRPEFIAERLKGAKNPNGTREEFIQGSAGYTFQYISGCNPQQTIRPLGPDDANLDLIYRRWDIRRWELRGLPSPASLIESIIPTFEDHLARFAKFQAHLRIAGSGDISFSELVTMQGETFSYLTTTGVSMAGFAIGTGALVTEANILIRAFVVDVDVEEEMDRPHTTSRVLRSWSAIVEKRVNVPARQATW